jgi:two-component system chemotaxis sensor kinase CheA
VVTDIDMPEMDGYALAEKLRTSERGATLPIIGLSSTASLEGVERARAAGFYDIVAKFDRQGLLAALNERAHVGHAA